MAEKIFYKACIFSNTTQISKKPEGELVRSRHIG